MLALQMSQIYLHHTAPNAVLLVGSAAEGISDPYSDLDMILYYDQVPSEGQLTAARTELDAQRFSLLAPRSEQAVLETFLHRGVDCQLVHTSAAAFEEQIDAVLVKHQPGTVTQKVLEGLVHGVALHGKPIIDGWKSQAAYPPELQEATVVHFLQIRPIWYVAHRVSGRDAAIFMDQLRIDATLNILGILAGVNGLYFSTFQFKRMTRFARTLELAPANLAARLEQAFTVGSAESAAIIEELARETLDIVSQNLPHVNLAAIRHPPGSRQEPWKPSLA